MVRVAALSWLVMLASCLSATALNDGVYRISKREGVFLTLKNPNVPCIVSPPAEPGSQDWRVENVAGGYATLRNLKLGQFARPQNSEINAPIFGRGDPFSFVLIQTAEPGVYVIEAPSSDDPLCMDISLTPIYPRRVALRPINVATSGWTFKRLG